MVKVTDADEWRITDADIEAIADDDPVWKVAERVVYENHGVGNAAVIIRRYYMAGVKAGLEAAAKVAEQYDDKRSLMTGVGLAVHAIRNIDPEECE